MKYLLHLFSYLNINLFKYFDIIITDSHPLKILNIFSLVDECFNLFFSRISLLTI